MTDIEAQFQELIQAAKAHKAELDMAKLEYKHTMRKVGILAEQYPAMAQKLGLDPQTFYDISSVSSGQNWSMTSYCPVPGVGPQSPADNNYEGGFATALMLKDLTLALAAAKEAGVDPAMGKRARELYEAFANAGNAGRDFSAIIETLG